MSCWRTRRGSGFILAEAAVACLIAGVVIAASAAMLFTCAAASGRCHAGIERERSKREVLIDWAADEAIQRPVQ